MILRGHNSLYLDSCPPCLWKGGRGCSSKGEAHCTSIGGGRGLMCDTCWGVTWAAWTGTLLYMCCPSAADAEHCSTHMRCRPFERTPTQIADISTKKMASDTEITFSHWWLSDGECYSSHLKRSHPDYLITVVEEVWEDIEDGCFRQDQFLNKQKKSSSFIFQEQLFILNTILNTSLFTCRFSMQNWCPYISIAERKMDSTWLCRSS